MVKSLFIQEPDFTIRAFGIKRNEKMACHVTMRGDRALDILKKGLRVKDNELKKKNFSNTGNNTKNFN